jgi:4-hydroxyphenylpyruvate dioxygenase
MGRDMNQNHLNPLGLNGIEFLEFASPDPAKLNALFLEFGFSKKMEHQKNGIDFYRQNQIVFLLNRKPNSFAEKFKKLHGPSISSMGWKFENPRRAFEMALERGARAPEKGDYLDRNGLPVPCIYGIGDSLIYFIDAQAGLSFYHHAGFTESSDPILVPDKGFLEIDHLTNNVSFGSMKEWSDFYKNIFGFTEVRYFDIRGAATGLQSYALRSPCGKFSIPINEANEKESQINEYLREYQGPGIQHLAFLTEDILQSLQALKGTSIQTLEIDDDYYAEVFKRVPHVTEDHQAIRDLNVLVDGDEKGYLLQIFTKNLIGPIFIEIIQRKNHYSFGEGNFTALFKSIERDQMNRGVISKTMKP